jgi:hypothetical protein
MVARARAFNARFDASAAEVAEVHRKEQLVRLEPTDFAQLEECRRDLAQLCALAGLYERVRAEVLRCSELPWQNVQAQLRGVVASFEDFERELRALPTHVRGFRAALEVASTAESLLAALSALQARTCAQRALPAWTRV